MACCGRKKRENQKNLEEGKLSEKSVDNIPSWRRNSSRWAKKVAEYDAEHSPNLKKNDPTNDPSNEGNNS